MSEITIASIVVAGIAALPPTIAALSALWVVRANDVKTAHLEAKTDTLITKTDVIHELTNSNLTAVKSELAAALMQIKELQTLVSKLAERDE